MFLENISAPQDAKRFSSRRLFTLQVSRVSCIDNPAALAGEVIWLDNYGHVGCLLHFDWLRTATLANKLWPSEWGKTWENHENPQKRSFLHDFEKSGKIRREWGPSIHRQLRTYVSVIYAFTIFIYSICAQTKNIEDSVCKNARRMEEERKTRSTVGGPFILPWRGGGERGWLYSSDSGHTLLYAVKIIIALQIGQESVKGKNKLDQLTQKTSTDK